MRQPQGLIAVLLDKKADLASRDDAAMDLSNYCCKETIEALVLVGSDVDTPEMILSSCGESLAMLWAEIGELDRSVFERLQPIASTEVRAFLDANEPHLLHS